eukprot:COSAG01_NODE_8585_length_2728_cov_14.207684_5_plen_49_part_00
MDRHNAARTRFITKQQSACSPQQRHRTASLLLQLRAAAARFERQIIAS